jgi:hypothetical protein
MNANPRIIVNNTCDYITWHYYELGSLNNIDNDFLDLHMHEFNKGSTIIIKLMHGWIVWDIHTSKNLMKWLKLQHGMTMKQDMKDTFHLENFSIPFPYKSIYLSQNKLGTPLHI